MTYCGRAYPQNGYYTGPSMENTGAVSAQVERVEYMTSDYLPIRGYISSTGYVPNSIPSPIHVNKDRLPSHARVVENWVKPPLILDTRKKIEVYAHELCDHLPIVIKAAGTLSSQASCRSAPWQTYFLKWHIPGINKQEMWKNG